jgi:RimJ/RimL family protein N-acetyltransferase
MYPLMGPFLESERLWLKPMHEEDIPLLVKWLNEPRTHRFLKPRFPRTVERMRKLVNGVADHPYPENIGFIIMHKATNKPIGIVGLLEIAWVNRNAEIYVSLGEKEFWGQRLSEEANTLLLEYAFNDLNLHKIYALIFEGNSNSIKTAQRTGFKEEAILKDQVILDGKPHNLVMLSYFKADFHK